MIERGNPSGLLVCRRNGTQVWYFHLKIRNTRPRTTAVVKVCCTKIEREDEKGRWIPEVFPERLLFCWAYSDVYGVQRTVGDEAGLDLAFVDEGADEVKLALGIRPNNVRDGIKKGEKIKLYLGVEVNGHLQADRSIVELKWDGEWSNDASKMFENVSVRLLDGVLT